MEPPKLYPRTSHRQLAGSAIMPLLSACALLLTATILLGARSEPVRAQRTASVANGGGKPARERAVEQLRRDTDFAPGQYVSRPRHVDPGAGTSPVMRPYYEQAAALLRQHSGNTQGEWRAYYEDLAAYNDYLASLYTDSPLPVRSRPEMPQLKGAGVGTRSPATAYRPMDPSTRQYLAEDQQALLGSIDHFFGGLSAVVRDMQEQARRERATREAHIERQSRMRDRYQAMADELESLFKEPDFALYKEAKGGISYFNPAAMVELIGDGLPALEENETDHRQSHFEFVADYRKWQAHNSVFWDHVRRIRPVLTSELFSAADSGNLAMVRALLLSGADPYDTPAGSSVLAAAKKERNLDLAITLITDGWSDSVAPNLYSREP